MTSNALNAVSRRCQTVDLRSDSLHEIYALAGPELVETLCFLELRILLQQDDRFKQTANLESRVLHH
jgi:hypothetical protein